MANTVLKSEVYMPEKNVIYKNALKMAWPAMLESFLISMASFVDSIMVSSQGEEAIAAIGLSNQPKFIGLCAIFSLGTAVSSIVARRRGEENPESANKVTKTCLLITIIFGAIISTIFLIFASPIMHLAGTAPDTHDIAVSYLSIIMGGIIFNMITIIVNAAQRGAGNTKISMVTNTVSNIVNVILNFLLIEGRFGFPALGVNGAALATVIGSAVASFLSIRSLFKKDSFIYIRNYKGLKLVKKDTKSILDIGSSAFVEQFFLRIGFFIFALTVASLGTKETAAHMIAMNFMNISFSLADGLAIASVALVGRSLGQKNPELAKKYGTSCQKIGLICSIIVSCIFFFFGRNLFSLFSNDTQILDYGVMLMNILCIVLFLQVQQVAILGGLRGAGDTKFTALVSLISVAIVRPFISWLLCFPCGLGLFGVWMGLFGDQMIRFIMGYVRYVKGNWLKINI